MQCDDTEKFDVIFAGGGLASTLLAVRLQAAHPDKKLLIVEQADTLGADHTWSFHTTDLTTDQYKWLRPFIAHTWADQQLRFPAFTRVVDVGYNTITAASFHAAAMVRVGEAVRTGTRIESVNADHVRLACGTRCEAPCVIDGRGLQPEMPLALGFQKFLGLEIRTREPHGETRPTIMDATVPQDDGYRFIYTLPFDAHRMLVEDTYYSDGGALSSDALHSRIEDYAASRGWQIEAIERTENGILPVVLGGDIDAVWNNGLKEAAPVGLRAALFHPTTGYSLPDAVRLADEISQLERFDTRTVAAVVEQRSRKDWRERSYFRMLNRMLFKGATPGERVGIFQHFYRLNTELISRFYAAKLNPADKARILIGKPPIPISHAVPWLRETSVWPPR